METRYEYIPLHNYRTCTIIDCEECQGLIDYGIIIACDECDMVGDSNAFGWNLMDDGRVLCQGCFDKE